MQGPTTFGIPLLALVKSAQQQHGLRHGDYQRYRQYVSRKLRRMRKSLHFQQGTRSKVTPKKLTSDIVTDPRFITLRVFEIERSWAYAMQLKAESNTELRKRFQMISRLRKAVLRGNQLADLAAELPMLDAKTKLEIQAYVQWVRGTLSFELQDWIKAKEFLESMQAIYTCLIQTIEEDARAIYTARVADILPQIHYCAYNIGDKSAASDLQRMRAEATANFGGLAELQLDELLTQARASQAGQVTSVEWLGRSIPIKSEKAKMAVLAVNEADQETLNATTTAAKLSLYDSVLKSIVEAVSAVREELHTIPSAADGPTPVSAEKRAAVPSNISDKLHRLQALYSYLQFLKLSKTIERTLLHITEALSIPGAEASGQVKNGFGTGTFSKPQELARLYDTLVQNIQEILGLPSVIPECMGFKALLHAKMLSFRSYRCYYLAFIYLHGKRFAECSALLARAKRHATEALHSLSPAISTWSESESHAAPGPPPEQLMDALTSLVKQIESEDLACRAAYMLDTSGSGDRSSGATTTTETDVKLGLKPLIERLDRYLDVAIVEKSLASATNPFVQLPPPFEPVPVKPILFDLALNYVNFPSLADKVDSSGLAKDAGSGLAGLVRGWLWGKSNSQSDSKS